VTGFNADTLTNIVNQVKHGLQAEKPTENVTVQPQICRTAVVSGTERLEITERELKPLCSGEILVRIEACAVCDADVQKFISGTFAPIGVDGAATVVKVGDAVFDMFGKKVSEGDNISFASSEGIGLFSDCIVIGQKIPFFVANGVSAKARMLSRRAARVARGVRKAQQAGFLSLGTNVAVIGCGALGFVTIAFLRSCGIRNITVIDKESESLKIVSDIGGITTVNSSDFKDETSFLETIRKNGEIDFVFQTARNCSAHSTAYRVVKKSGGVCDIAFDKDAGTARISPFTDICNKEITLFGVSHPDLNDYACVAGFLKVISESDIKIEKIFGKNFELDKINDAMKLFSRQNSIPIIVNDSSKRL
jgi:L-iditol 2-dehydrogenase